jgi:hypothetical protein
MHFGPSCSLFGTCLREYYSAHVEHITFFKDGETSARTSRRGVRMHAHAHCLPVFNNDTFRASMEAASSSAPAFCPWLQFCAPPIHQCSFVLRACCHAHEYSFVLRTRFGSRAHAGTAAPEGTTFACRSCRACLWNTCNIKYLLQYTSETDEIFTTYVCNIVYGH